MMHAILTACLLLSYVALGAICYARGRMDEQKRPSTEDHNWWEC